MGGGTGVAGGGNTIRWDKIPYTFALVISFNFFREDLNEPVKVTQH